MSSNPKGALWAVACVRRPGERRGAHRRLFRWASDFTNGEEGMIFRRAKQLWSCKCQPARCRNGNRVELGRDTSRWMRWMRWSNGELSPRDRWPAGLVVAPLSLWLLTPSNDHRIYVNHVYQRSGAAADFCDSRFARATNPDAAAFEQLARSRYPSRLCLLCRFPQKLHSQSRRVLCRVFHALHSNSYFSIRSRDSAVG